MNTVVECARLPNQCAKKPSRRCQASAPKFDGLALGGLEKICCHVGPPGRLESLENRYYTIVLPALKETVRLRGHTEKPVNIDP